MSIAGTRAQRVLNLPPYLNCFFYSLVLELCQKVMTIDVAIKKLLFIAERVDRCTFHLQLVSNI